MRTLQTYVLRQLVVSLAFALAGISFVIFPGLTVSAAHKLQGAGVEALVRYMPLLAIDLVPYPVPMAFLLAVVSTFGRLAADNEWTALRMAGVHPLRMLLPGLLVAAVLSVGTAWLVSSVSPAWKHKQRLFKRQALSTALKTLYPGRTSIHIGDFYLNSFRRRGNQFEEVLVYLPGTGERDAAKLVSDVAHIDLRGDVLVMEFENARWVQGGGDVTIANPVIELPLDSLVEEDTVPRNRAKFMGNLEILEAVRSGELEPGRAREFTYEFHKRLALSFTYVLFLLLGAPTGVWLRKGTQLGALAVAVLYAIFYYVFSMQIGKELALFGAVPTYAAAWSTTAVGMLFGLVALRRVFLR